MNKQKLVMTEFLLDENVLGVDIYLKGYVKFRKIGDDECPRIGTTDDIVVKFASDNNLILVTNDDKMKAMCERLKVSYVTTTFGDLATKIIEYSK